MSFYQVHFSVVDARYKKANLRSREVFYLVRAGSEEEAEEKARKVMTRSPHKEIRGVQVKLSKFSVVIVR